ncbi:hypothetical protein NQ318_019416 [Aromia moschata]|uniref:Uncharacterized protein n=1 Tax=Aromia moschata TaxID=1265417 RepID=A0AAV8XK75_9CUCU|nr:hypothetical protein NQ318_019416 [Aromia moschata]
MLSNGKCFLCLLLLLYNVEGRPQEIKCPDYCKCDVFETLRRATCQNKKLYSIEIDIPPQAEILDLAYNQISELGSNIFLEIGLGNLKLLNLSHNKVSQIHLNGFQGLTNLKTLDLSFNMMRYFTEHWFVSLNSLRELYLRGNNLKSINEEPSLNLPHLRVLDISQCAITSLRPGVLDNVPELQVLDASENFMIDFDIEVIAPLVELDTLIINDNNFDCNDGSMTAVKNYAREKLISYKDPCPSNQRSGLNEKFQRMMVEEPQVPKKNIWIYDEDEETLRFTKIIEVCTDGNQTRNFSGSFNGMLVEVFHLSPILFVLTILVFGILLGLVIGCSVEITEKAKLQQTHEYINLPDGVNPYRRRTRSVDSRNFQRQDSSGSYFRPRTRSGGSRKMIREDRSVLVLDECGLSNSTPVIPRKTYV